MIGVQFIPLSDWVRARPKANHWDECVGTAEGCPLVFYWKCWAEFEADANGRVPEEVRVRALPGSCAGCAFCSTDRLWCRVAWRRFPRPPFDECRKRAPFCPLVQDAGARLDVCGCPAVERMEDILNHNGHNGNHDGHEVQEELAL